MKERSFDEMIAFFNRRVADMDISQDCRMELFGMVTALGYKHEKSVPQWIPCSERLPEAETMYFRPKHRYLCQRKNEMFVGARFCEPNGMLKEWWDWYGTKIRDEDVAAWMPLQEPYKEES